MSNIANAPRSTDTFDSLWSLAEAAAEIRRRGFSETAGAFKEAARVIVNGHLDGERDREVAGAELTGLLADAQLVICDDDAERMEQLTEARRHAAMVANGWAGEDWNEDVRLVSDLDGGCDLDAIAADYALTLPHAVALALIGWDDDEVGPPTD